MQEIQANHILSRLSFDDLEILRPYLSACALSARQLVQTAGEAITCVYFPMEGLISATAGVRRGRQSEIGLVGRDGFSGCSVILGEERAPIGMCVQVGGRALKIAAKDLTHAMEKSESLRFALHRFLATFMAQAAYTALANSDGTISERLSRWILMAHDRLGGDAVPVTHEAVSIALGVRRAGVTVGLNRFAGMGAIDIQRSHLKILDRLLLERHAGGLYGAAEAEHYRLTGWKPESFFHRDGQQPDRASPQHALA
jgi:CRP-like cAMP-binding protein